MSNKREPFPDGMSRCSLCGELKPLSEFSKDKSTINGASYRCKKCLHEQARIQYRKKIEQNHNYKSERYKRLKEKAKSNLQDPNTLKKCNKCGETKPLSSFQRSPLNKGGYSTYCTECLRKQHLEYRNAHREEINAKRRKSYLEKIINSINMERNAENGI